jgi:hypothetical protein
LFYVNNWAALGNEVQFELGPQVPPGGTGTHNAGCKLRFGRDAGGGHYFQVDTTTLAAGAEQDEIYIPKTMIPNWPDVTGVLAFEFSIVGSTLTLRANGSVTNGDQWVVAFIGAVPRFGSIWQPKITCTAGAVNNQLYFDRAASGYAQASSQNPYARAMYMPTMTDFEASGTQGGLDVIGGGGIGHASVLMGLFAIQAALDSCDFSAGS